MSRPENPDFNNNPVYPQADRGSRLPSNGHTPIRITETYVVPNSGSLLEPKGPTFEVAQPSTDIQVIRRKGEEKPITFGGGTSPKSIRRARERAERQEHRK